jgi:phosphoribosylaminoimidazole carboxylase PurE protein
MVRTQRVGGTEKAKVGIVMGSDSDMETMMEAVKVLKEFGVGFDLDIVSAHRSPLRAHKYATEAQKKGYEIIIAGAGGAAALPGFMASLTTLPVIGVPVIGNALGGEDALYSMVQMPGGVPVAVAGMGKTGAKNAAILAVEILALKDSTLSKKLQRHKARLAKEVEQRSKEIKKRGT